MRMFLALCLLFATSLPAEAGLFHRWARRSCAARAYPVRACVAQKRPAQSPLGFQQAQLIYSPTASPRSAYGVPQDAQPPLGSSPGHAGEADAYGFTAWLNATRASYGLVAVVYDPSLTQWAALNNSHQLARGLGHYVMGSARRQNSAIGHYASIGATWLNSPAHRAALLDPTVRAVGLAGNGPYWTANLR